MCILNLQLHLLYSIWQYMILISRRTISSMPDCHTLKDHRFTLRLFSLAVCTYQYQYHHLFLLRIRHSGFFTITEILSNVGVPRVFLPRKDVDGQNIHHPRADLRVCHHFQEVNSILISITFTQNDSIVLKFREQLGLFLCLYLG
jgi:hypothetical protein